MSLADLIRQRRTRSLATAIPAIPAIPATDSPEKATAGGGSCSTVARIATVAVANPPEPLSVFEEDQAANLPLDPHVANPPEPLSVEDEATIAAWLEHIGETDPEELARVWERCRTRRDTRAYVLAQAADMAAGPADSPTTAAPAEPEASIATAPEQPTGRPVVAIQRPDVRAAADAFHNHLFGGGGCCHGPSGTYCESGARLRAEYDTRHAMAVKSLGV